MDHKNNYSMLRNTLYAVETNGKNTLVMADCLRFLEQCIKKCEQVEEKQTNKAETQTTE